MRSCRGLYKRQLLQVKPWSDRPADLGAARAPRARDDARVALTDTREHRIAPVRDRLFALIDDRLPARARGRRARVRHAPTCGACRPAATTSPRSRRCSARSPRCSRSPRGRGTEPIAVRAYNPTREDDGYERARLGRRDQHRGPGRSSSTRCPPSLQARGVRVQRVLHPIVGVERDGDGRITAVLHPREASTRESVMHFDLDRRLAAGRARRDSRRACARCSTRSAARARLPRDDRPRAADERTSPARAPSPTPTTRSTRPSRSSTGCCRTTSSSSATASTRSATADRRHRRAPASACSPTRTPRRTPSRSRSTRCRRRARARDHGRPDDRLQDQPALARAQARADGLRRRPARRRPTARSSARRACSACSPPRPTPSRPPDAAAAPQAAPDAAPRGPDRGLARLQGRGDAVRLVPQGRAVHRADRRPAARGRDAALAAGRPDPADGPLRARRAQRVADRRAAALALRRRPAGAPARPLPAPLRDRLGRLAAPSSSRTSACRCTSPCTRRAAARSFVPRARARGHRARAHVGRPAARGLACAPRPGARTRARGALGAPLPRYYKASVEPALAVHDVECFERLETAGEPFVVGLQNAPAAADARRALQVGGKVELSEVMPTLEHLGLRVIEEVPTRLPAATRTPGSRTSACSAPTTAPLDLDAVGDARRRDCIAAVRRGDTESDTLNRLVVVAGLDWRQVDDPARLPQLPPADRLALHRALPERRAGRPTRRHRQADALLRAAPRPRARARRGRRAGAARGDPGRPRRGRLARPRPHPAQPARADRRDAAHERVPAEPRRDRVQAALGRRCRRSRSPRRVFEIYLYSLAMEGIHLRGGPVARGGLRWSDRMDFRTEVYGLMRAQLIKNAVIVPTGAKGGFYLPQPPAGRDELRPRSSASTCATSAGCSSLTDNLVDGEIVHPEGVRVLDEPGHLPRRRGRQGHRDVLGPRQRVAQDAASGSATRSPRAARPARPQGARDHRARGLGVGQAPLPRARDRPARDEFTVVGIGDMTRRRVRQRHAAAQQDPPRRRLRPPARVHRPGPRRGGSFDERRRLFELTSPRGTTTTARCLARRRVPAHGQASLSRGARGAGRSPTSAAARPSHPGDPARARRSAVERRHRHGRQGVGRVARTSRRTGPRRRSGSTPTSCGRASWGRAATSA